MLAHVQERGYTQEEAATARVTLSLFLSGGHVSLVPILRSDCKTEATLLRRGVLVQEMVEDPWAPAVAQAQERGFTREEAAMALVVVGMAATQDKVWALRMCGFCSDSMNWAGCLQRWSFPCVTA